MFLPSGQVGNYLRGSSFLLGVHLQCPYTQMWTINSPNVQMSHQYDNLRRDLCHNFANDLINLKFHPTQSVVISM